MFITLTLLVHKCMCYSAEYLLYVKLITYLLTHLNEKNRSVRATLLHDQFDQLLIRYDLSELTKVNHFDSNRKGMRDFLLVTSSNFGHILHRFRHNCMVMCKCIDQRSELSKSMTGRCRAASSSGVVGHVMRRIRQIAASEPEEEIRRRLSWRTCHVILLPTTASASACAINSWR